jgi:GDPmannose 4,6-dehydratase
VATGESISIRDFLGLTFVHLALDWQKYVEIDPRYFRPAEVDHLEGDPAKGRRILGWEPKVDIRALATMMVDSDLKLAQKEQVLRDAGHGEAPRVGYR